MKKLFKKLTKKVILIILAILIIGAPLLYLTVINSKSTSAAWFDDNWAYRQAVPITNTSGSTQTNYQLSFTVDTQALVTAGKMQSSCQDVRIIDMYGKSYPFWIEPTSCNTTTTKIWTKIPSLPANNTTIYMYYGNPSVSSTATTPSNIFIREITGLQASWQMDESSWGSVLDSSGNGSNGTASGATGGTAGKFGNAGSFANASDLVNAGSGSSLDNLTAWTYSVWVNPSTLTPGYIARIMCKGAAGCSNDSNGAGFSMNGNGYINANQGYSGTDSYSITSTTIPLSAWTHLTVSFSSTDKLLHIYFNGTEQSYSSQVAAPGSTLEDNNTANFLIGNIPAADRGWRGLIDGAQVYNQKLTDAEILDLGNNYGYTTTNYANKTLVAQFNSSISTTNPTTEETSPAPIVYWKFDEGIGTTASDSTSQKHNGTISGADWKEEGLCVFGKCLYFDGAVDNNDNVSVADNSSLDFDTSSFSLSAWVKYSGAASAQSLIIAKAENVTYTGYKLYMDASGDLCFDTGDGTNSDSACTSGVDFDDNNWHQVTGIKTGTSKLELYVDGKLRATDGSIAATATLSNANPFYVGIDQDGISNEWKGFIDEVKVYDYARSAAQVKTDFASRGSVKGVSAQIGGADQEYLSEGLVGYWKMDESSGNATDSSGNGTTLTDGSTTTYAGGKFGNGADLESTSTDYLYAADNATLSLTGNLTIGGWIKPESTTADTQFDIAGKWDGSNQSYLLAQYGDEIRMYIDSSGNYVETTAANLTIGTWYHVLGTYSTKDQTVKIYINGDEKATSTTGTIPSSIGDDSGRFHIGAEDSTTQILDLQVATGTDDTYRSQWSWSATGSILRTGSLSGDTPLNTSARFTGVSGLEGATITTSYYSTRTGADAGAGTPLTKIYADDQQAAAAPTSAAEFNSINPTTAGVDWDDQFSSTGTWYDSPSLNTVIQELVNSYGNNLTVIQLVHKDDGSAAGNNYQVYVPYEVGSSLAPKLHIEFTTPPNYYDGLIDEVRVYNRALSPKEVSDLYNWAPGPVGYWKMDDKVSGDSKTIVDISGNGNNGTTVDGANNTGMNCNITGKIGGACQFDGTDDYVNASSASILDDLPNGDFTFSWWQKYSLATAASFPVILGKRNGLGTNGWTIWTGQSSYAINFSAIFDGTTASYKTPTGKMVNGQWQYISIVWSSSSKSAKIYINGIESTLFTQTPGSGTYQSDISNNLILGGDNTGNKFSGNLDEVKVYNYARTQKQIVSDMNGGHPAVGSPVGSSVAYWKFDEGYSTIAHDSGQARMTGGSGKDLTLSSASWTNSGKFGKAWNGVGTNWLSRADDADLDFAAADDFSYSLWFKSTSATNPGTGTSEYLVQKVSTSGYSIYANDAGKIVFSDTDGTNIDTVTSSSDIYDGTWHHILAEKTGTSRLDLYVDGKLDASNTSLTNTSTLANAGTLYLGDKDGVNNGDEFNGDLDEVKVYRYALTANEVKTEFNRGSSLVLGAAGNSSTYSSQAANQEYCVPGDTTSCAAPVGEWKFEEGSGTTANDSSGNGYNGTISGATYTTGKYGKALNFNAGTDVVDTISSIAGIQTVSFWVYPTSTTANLIDLQTAPGTINISASSGTISATGFGTPTIYVNGTASTTLTANAWQYIIVTTATPITGSAVRFGRISTTSMTGKLDDIRFYNYARTPAQIAWDYNRGKPVAHWKFNECQGGSVYDSSGNNNTGTINLSTTGTQTTAIGNGTCTTNASTPWYNGRTGKFNSSLNFDGSDDYVEIADNNIFSFGDGTTDKPFSISLWTKFTDTTDSTLISKYNTDSTGGTKKEWLLFADSSDRLTFNLYDNGAGNIGRRNSSAISQNTWHHIVATYNGSSQSSGIILYLDGIRIDDTDNNALLYTAMENLTQPVHIGRISIEDGGAGSGTPLWLMDGQLDDVRIYNYALTQTQVKDAYNNGAVFFGPSTGTP